jgi:hypothetical protein
MPIEVFGTPEQQSMQLRGEALLRLLRDDPRFCSHGRGVQLSDYNAGSEMTEMTVALARIHGASGCEMVPNGNAEEYIDTVETLGLKTDLYANYIGSTDVIEGARALLREQRLPDDLTLRIIDQESPGEWLYALAEVALERGVLPSAGPVLRGISRPGFGMVAMDQNDRPVATACAAMARHKNHPDHAMAQWGQLATRDDRKGQGIARMMAAHSIVHAADALGTLVFSTGIRPGNTPSERLCSSLGLQPSAYSIVIVIDPLGFSGERTTK